MNLLFDHCVPARFARLLTGHNVKTDRSVGFDALRNGELLAAATDTFDALITCDRGFGTQHHLPDLPIAVIIMFAQSNTLSSLAEFAPHVQAALSTLAPRTLIRVGPSGLLP